MNICTAPKWPGKNTGDLFSKGQSVDNLTDKKPLKGHSKGHSKVLNTLADTQRHVNDGGNQMIVVLRKALSSQNQRTSVFLNSPPLDLPQLPSCQ